MEIIEKLDLIARYYIRYDVMMPWGAKFKDIKEYIKSFLNDESVLNSVMNQYNDLIMFYLENEPILVNNLSDIQGIFNLNIETFKYHDQFEDESITFALAKLHGDLHFKINSIVTNYSLNFPDDGSTLFELFPELLDSLDKRYRILPWNLFEIENMILKYKDHVINFHPYIGRHCEKVIKELLIKEPKLDCKISLDSERVLHITEFVESFYLSTWRGFMFNENIMNNKLNVVTVIGRDLPTVATRIGMKSLNRVEVMWEEANDEKHGLVRIFKLEEILNDDEKYSLKFKGNDFVLNRFFHSIYAVESGKFVHLDASMNVYEKNNYKNRFSADLKRNIKSYLHKKLFQINGGVSTSDWLDIILSFFQHDSAKNELVLEYFDPNNEMNDILRRRLPDSMIN